jgi:hypothetical protein
MSQEKSDLEQSRAEEIAEIATIALEAIPYAGGILAGTASYVIERRKNRRLNQFLLDLSEDLKSLEDKINRDLVRTEDFEDLCEDIFSRASENRQQEKLDSFRNLFVNTMIADNPDYNEAAEIAQLIDSWQPRHIILLRIMGAPLDFDNAMGNPVGEGGGIYTSINQILQKLFPEWNPDQIDRTWKELNDARVHKTPDTRTMISDHGIHQLENRLTEYGKKVVDYIIR